MGNDDGDCGLITRYISFFKSQICENGSGTPVFVAPIILCLLVLVAFCGVFWDIEFISIIAIILVVLHCIGIIYIGNTVPDDDDDLTTVNGNPLGAPKDVLMTRDIRVDSDEITTVSGNRVRPEEKHYNYTTASALAPAARPEGKPHNYTSASASAQVPSYENKQAVQDPSCSAKLVLPHWWERKVDHRGKVYYKNNFKKTTSWKPPSLEQIALETKEKYAAERGTTAGYDASAPAPPGKPYNYAKASAPVPANVPSYEIKQAVTDPSYSTVSVLPHWWETKIDQRGKVYYMNNFKKTTSWKPPSAAQIAQETKERNAAERGTTSGYDASAPPPAFGEEPHTFYEGEGGPGYY